MYKKNPDNANEEKVKQDERTVASLKARVDSFGYYQVFLNKTSGYGNCDECQLPCAEC